MEWVNRPNPYSGLIGQTSDVPDFVTVDDVPAPTASAFSLGCGSKGAVTVDLAESPHVLVNAPTNKGKSAVARFVAAQRLSMGDVVVVLDRKMHSHRWARELTPVVPVYADSVPAIGSALLNLAHELHRRNRVVRDGVGEVGPRIVVVFEETNATLTQLKALDKCAVQGAAGALDAFSDLMFMGRAVDMHVIAFAQLASYRSGLTADLIENFDVKVMIGYSPQAWRWLASDCGKYRVAPVGVGRSMVCQGGKAREVQLGYVPEESVVEYVTASLPAQRRARELAGGRRRLSPIWRSAIGR